MIPHEIIALGPNQSARLAELAPQWSSVFVVIGRESHPGDPNRYRLHIVPATVKTAADALAVATGEKKASKQRPRESQVSRVRAKQP